MKLLVYTCFAVEEIAAWNSRALWVKFRNHQCYGRSFIPSGMSESICPCNWTVTYQTLPTRNEEEYITCCGACRERPLGRNQVGKLVPVWLMYMYKGHLIILKILLEAAAAAATYYRKEPHDDCVNCIGSSHRALIVSWSHFSLWYFNLVFTMHFCMNRKTDVLRHLRQMIPN